MRIIGGKFKGQAIQAPTGNDTRPTTDRVRESLFNILHHRDDVDFENAKILDCFAGTGALGLEAISRGATYCLFVETAAPARAVIRTNCEHFNLLGNTRIHRRSAAALGNMPATETPFDIVFMDAPYDKSSHRDQNVDATQNLTHQCLVQLRDHGWLSPNAIAIVEQFKKEPAIMIDGFEELDRREFGDTQIGILKFVGA